MNELVCLAKSEKFDGYCIVGKELTGRRKWIRPVFDYGKGEIPAANLKLDNGNILHKGDIITIPELTHNPENHQQENYLASEGKWHFVRKFTGNYDYLLDSPDKLWINGLSSTNVKNDRVEYDKAITLKSSVFFIKVKEFELFTDTDSSESKLRIAFEYNRVKYILRVTDDEHAQGDIIKRIGTVNVFPYIYLTISLTQNFTGFCYKLAAAVIQPQIQR